LFCVGVLKAMNWDQVAHWRNVAGKAGAFCCVIFLLAALDGLSAQFRQPSNVFQLLPGESVKINGSLGERIEGVQELEYFGSSDLIRLSFDAVHSGFWLGGQMWRGELTVDPGTKPGDYGLSVTQRGKEAQKPSSVFVIKIHEDYQALRGSSKSFIRRYLDASPWWIFGLFFPLACLVFAVVYCLSQKEAHLLALAGKAEIYRVARGETAYEIDFGMGTRHGIQPGMRLTVINERGVPVGSAEVQKASEADSSATTDLGCPVKPGYLVSLEAHSRL